MAVLDVHRFVVKKLRRTTNMKRKVQSNHLHLLHTLQYAKGWAAEVFSSCSRELRKLTSFNTSGKRTQVGRALVVQKHFIRFHLNYKTITLIFPLFLMDLDLTTREFDTTLHVDKSLKIEAELGKFTELYIFHQGLAARFFSVMTFPTVPTFQLCWFG